MYTLHHPSHLNDLKTLHPSKKDLIAYLGDETTLNTLINLNIISYADDSTKDKSKDTESKPKLVKSSRGDK